MAIVCYDIYVMFMIVKIDKLSNDFRGISRINDKVLFIPSVLPEEVVDARITIDKKNYSIGKAMNIITESSNRRKSICPYFDTCGGCSTGYIKYDKALVYKKESVIDIMKRYAGYDVNPEIISNYKEYGYRNKIGLKVFNGKVSLTEEESNNLVNIDKCYLVNDNINKVIDSLNKLDLTGINDVVIKGTNEIMVILNGDTDRDMIINSLKGMVKSIVLNDEVIYGNDYITINVDKYKYAVYPKSFFQVNTDMISKLYDKVKEAAGKGESLLDLYCGAGTIGIYLADNFNRVRGIEINSDAVEGANLNKKINDIGNISFECKRASDINSINEEVVVVDPPRGGLDKTTTELLCNSNVKRIVYVSCNPITLARDINVLKSKYELKDITLFDMFPNTKHVESVCLLEKR